MQGTEVGLPSLGKVPWHLLVSGRCYCQNLLLLFLVIDHPWHISVYF